MATAGQFVRERIPVPATVPEAGRLILELVGSSSDSQAESAGPMTFRVVRHYRPTWATALSFLIFPLFVKKTEVCRIAVIEARIGAEVLIEGHLDPGLHEALLQLGRVPEAARVATLGPRPVPQVLAQQAGFRPPSAAGPPPQAAQLPAPPYAPAPPAAQASVPGLPAAPPPGPSPYARPLPDRAPAPAEAGGPRQGPSFRPLEPAPPMPGNGNGNGSHAPSGPSQEQPGWAFGPGVSVPGVPSVTSAQGGWQPPGPAGTPSGPAAPPFAQPPAGPGPSAPPAPSPQALQDPFPGPPSPYAPSGSPQASPVGATPDVAAPGAGPVPPPGVPSAFGPPLGNRPWGGPVAPVGVPDLDGPQQPPQVLPGQQAAQARDGEDGRGGQYHPQAPAPVDPVGVPPTTAQPPRPNELVVSIDSGETSVVGALLLIGRAPSRAENESHAKLLTVNDPSLSVSKTHLAIGVDHAGLWVVDRNSTNGTWIDEGRGELDRLEPGKRTTVPPGARVLIGERVLTFTRQG